jgi:CDP-diacylglycerol--serine O-phosphatidyltransferase
VPAPLGAGLTLSPLFLDLWATESFGGYDGAFRHPAFVAVVTLATALLMVSSLPTFSWGKMRIRPQWRLMALAGIALIVGAAFTAPWMTLSLLSVAYALTIPFSIQAYGRLKRRGEAANPSPDASEPVAALPPPDDAPKAE